MEIKRELPEIARRMLAREADLDLRTVDTKMLLNHAQDQLDYVKTADLSPKVRFEKSSLIKE